MTWDGASLKVISDGLTIDENGIALQQQASGVYSPTRAVQWTGGAYLWDSSVNNAFELQRASGTIQLVALNGTVLLQGGGSGIDRAQLNIGSNYIQLQGVVAGGGRPQFQPDTDVLWDLGNPSRRFRTGYIASCASSSFIGQGSGNYIKTVYAGFAGNTPNSYYLELAADYAAKPLSSTWTVPPCSREAKDEITPVDPDAALALVRRVPLVRFRYNGALSSLAGERAIGVVAEDVMEIMPDSFKPDLTGARLGWNAHELFVLNVAAVQALAARLDALERTSRDS